MYLFMQRDKIKKVFNIVKYQRTEGIINTFSLESDF